MLKMKSAPQSLLKKKGQKSAPHELMKIRDLSFFCENLLKEKELGAKLAGSALERYGKPRFVIQVWSGAES